MIYQCDLYDTIICGNSGYIIEGSGTTNSPSSVLLKSGGKCSKSGVYQIKPPTRGCPQKYHESTDTNPIPHWEITAPKCSSVSSNTDPAEGSECVGTMQGRNDMPGANSPPSDPLMCSYNPAFSMGRYSTHYYVYEYVCLDNNYEGCDDSFCNNHGTAVTGEFGAKFCSCTCDSGYSGLNCQFQGCPPKSVKKGNACVCELNQGLPTSDGKNCPTYRWMGSLKPWSQCGTDQDPKIGGEKDPFNWGITFSQCKAQCDNGSYKYMAAFPHGCWCYNTCKASAKFSIGGMSSDLIGVFEKEFASTGNSTPQQAINVCFMVVLLSLMLL